jgi:lipoate-protein ligase A
MSGVASSGSADGASGAQGAHHHHKLSDKAVGALADKLGMSADDLKAKLESSNDPRKTLDQLAEDKGISKQELRDTIRSAMPRPAGGEGGGPGGPGGAGHVNFDSDAGKKLLANLADKLGTTSDDLKSQLDNGANLKDLLKAKGVSHEDVRAAFEDAFKSWQSYSANGNASGTSSTVEPAMNAVDVQV